MSTWAKKAGEAKTGGGGNYLDAHGRYLLRCGEVINKTGDDGSEAGHSGEIIIFKLEIVEAAKIAANVSSKRPGEPHLVGDVRSLILNFSNANAYAGEKLRSFLFGVLKKTDADFPNDKEGTAKLEALVKRIYSAEQPLMGVLVRAETREFITKSGPNAGKPGIAIEWKHVPDQTAETVKAAREAMLGIAATPAAAPAVAAPAAAAAPAPVPAPAAAPPSLI